MLASRLMRHRRPVIWAAQIVLVVAAYSSAFALRFDGKPPASALPVFLDTLGILVAVRLAAFAAFGLHRGFYKHFGLVDLLAQAKAVTAGTVMFVGGLALFGMLGAVPRSVPVIEWLITLLFASSERFAVRYALEGRMRRRVRRTGAGKRVLVVGAGEAAERLLRQINHDGERAMTVVALLDDDVSKHGRSLHGVSVIGGVERLGETVRREQIGLVVIAISRATPEQMRRIVRHCLDARVEFKRLPSMRSLLEGGAKAGVLADVQLEHLLVREPVAFDEERVSRNIGGSAVLITGAGGSVGSELTRQIARAKPGKLVLVDQAESALYFIDLEIRRSHPNIEVVPIVADIANRDSTMRLFEEHRPAHVYHAAAYKHVPLMERNIREAVRNNIWGTLSVAECAAAHGARQFVLISTDKAVRPSSVMGATKRVAERIVLGWPSLVRSDTEFRAVRFGNVLGSDGSVVPLFKKQLAHGGPLTVTHPDVRRYFMTIMEAAQLVLHAAVLPDAAGRITMLDMGAQIRILDLAENLVRLSGMEPHRDIQIVFTGLRPGEKIEEELMSAVEQVVPTSAEKVGIVQSDEVDGAAVQQTVERLLIAANCDDVQASLALLRELVPECVPPLMGIGVATQASAPRTRERVARNVAQSAAIV